MKTAKSLAGTDREYLVPCGQFRLSVDNAGGNYKVHIPRNKARIEKNRIVVMFSSQDLLSSAQAIRKVTGK